MSPRGNQFCHSPSVKAMTPSEVERKDSHAAGVKLYRSTAYETYHHRSCSPSRWNAIMPRGSSLGVGGGLNHLCEVEVPEVFAEVVGGA